jgi:hypothetical protein
MVVIGIIEVATVVIIGTFNDPVSNHHPLHKPLRRLL